MCTNEAKARVLTLIGVLPSLAIGGGSIVIKFGLHPYAEKSGDIVAVQK
jgi:hypothetical protein